jgi:hypothetical protein
MLWHKKGISDKLKDFYPTKGTCFLVCVVAAAEHDDDYDDNDDDDDEDNAAGIIITADPRGRAV